MTGRALYHLARADFLERVRRHGFLVALACMGVAAYVYLPPTGAPYVTLSVAGNRGVYNSAWIGTATASLSSSLLFLVVFFLVKNAVERDRATGVGQILATTPLTRPLYTLGKFLSNFAVAAAMVGVIAVVSGAVQLIRGEDLRLDPVALLLPFVLVVLPAMALASALAVLFEAVPPLRGGLGNVAFFFLWISLLALSNTGPVDPLGLGLLNESVTEAGRATGLNTGGESGADFSTGFGPPQTFEYEGIAWSPVAVLGRVAWFGVAAGIAVLAALPFDRFDAARESARPAARNGAKTPAPEAAVPVAVRPAAAGTAATLAPLGGVRGAGSSRFFAVLAAELRLMLKGRPPLWYVVAAVVAVAGLLLPAGIGQRFVLPVAWIWPLLIWSSMGARERLNNTEGLVFSAPHPLGRQLPASWLAGVLVAAALGGGVLVRLAAVGDGVGMLGWVAGALFVPALALASGASSGGGKLFEALYLLMWYLGPINGLSWLDYAGASDPGPYVSTAFLAATAALLLAAGVGRRRRVAS